MLNRFPHVFPLHEKKRQKEEIIYLFKGETAYPRACLKLLRNEVGGGNIGSLPGQDMKTLR